MIMHIGICRGGVIFSFIAGGDLQSEFESGFSTLLCILDDEGAGT